MDSLQFVEIAKNSEKPRFIGDAVLLAEFAERIRKAVKSMEKLAKMFSKMYPKYEENIEFPKHELKTCKELPFIFGDYKQGSEFLLGFAMLITKITNCLYEIDYSLKKPAKETTQLVIKSELPMFFAALALLCNHCDVTFEEIQIEAAKGMKNA